MTNINNLHDRQAGISRLKPIRLPNCLEPDLGKEFMKDLKAIAVQTEEYEPFVSDPEIHRNDLNALMAKAGIFGHINAFVNKHANHIQKIFITDMYRKARSGKGAKPELMVKKFLEQFSGVDKLERPIFMSLVQDIANQLLIVVSAVKYERNFPALTNFDNTYNSLNELIGVLSKKTALRLTNVSDLPRQVEKLRKDINSTTFAEGAYNAVIHINGAGQFTCTNLFKVKRNVQEQPFTLMDVDVYFDNAGDTIRLQASLTAMHSYLAYRGTAIHDLLQSVSAGKSKAIYFSMMREIYRAIEDKIIEMPEEKTKAAEYPLLEEDSDEVEAQENQAEGESADEIEVSDDLEKTEQEIRAKIGLNSPAVEKKESFAKGERQKLRNVSRDDALACLKKFGVHEIGRSGPHTKLERLVNGKVEHFPFMNAHSTDTSAMVLRKCLRRFQISRKDFLEKLSEI